MKTKRNILILLAIFACVSISMAQLPSYVPSNGLVGWWPFDGNADDLSSNQNNGTVYGCSSTPDRFGVDDNAFSFNGSSDYIEVQDDVTLDVQNVTISAWYNAINYGLPSQLEQGHIVSKREPSGWGSSFQLALISINDNGIWATYTLGANAWVDYSPLLISEWIHVVYTHDNDSAKLFIDGVKVNSVYASGGLTTNSLPMWFGARPNAGGNSSFLQGSLDDIGIWNRALTQSEITSLYQSEEADYGLVAHYPFNGNANDESGNGNDGIINGTITPTTDRFGNNNSAYLFDGQTGYISIPSLNSLSYSPITYSAWVIINSYFPPPVSGHNFRTIIGRQTAYVTDCGAIGFAADGNYGGIYDNTFWNWIGAPIYPPDSPVSDSIPALNTWVHVAYTQDTLGDWKWYTDGVLTNFGNFTNPQNYYDYFRIGGSNNSSGGNTFWNDKLDDISIWNRPLSQYEIDSLYHVGGWQSLTADFNADITAGNVPLTVNFTDQSTGNPTIWKWDFENDGVFDSYVQNPSWTYANTGSYSVKLVIENVNGADSLVKYDYITVSNTGYGLIAQYPFNGNANDESGNGNDGIVYGATLTQDRFGNANSAYNFDVTAWSWGSGGHEIYIPFAENMNSNNISVSTWTKRTSGGNYPSPQPLSIACRFQYGYSTPNGESWVLGIDNVNGPNPSKIYGHVIDQSQTYVSAISQDSTIVGVWNHIVMTYDGTDLKIFQDGQLVASEPSNGLLINTEGNSGISIGMSDQANGHWAPFDGDIDDITLWSRALTNTEIDSLYHVGGWNDIVCDFSGSPVNGTSPLNVSFSDLSTGNPTIWKWDFDNDGTFDSFSQNPTHTYNSHGIYSVKLVIEDGTQTDSLIKVDYINVTNSGNISADFVADSTSGITPLVVNFTDLSTGSPTTWKWDFENDGVFDSYIQFPSYTYTNSGSYSVKLVIENNTLTDTLIKYNYINVSPPSTGTDLIAFYPFNGNADDESGNGNNGAVMGATLTNDRYGNENSAYSFDGINDYIFSSIGDSDTLAVSFWYKASTPDKYYPSFFSYDGTGFFGQYGGTLNPPYIPGDVICFPANYGLQSLPIPAFNEWHHVYMDIDNVGHTQKVYVDGNYDNTYTGVSTITTGDDFNIGVGDPNGTPSQYFTGNLDDFKIYGRRLNSQEILDLYNQSNVQTPEICIVTVDDQIGYNLVVWEKQVTTEIDSFNVYRETTQANVFELIGTVSYIDAGIYIDENSVPVQRAYKYKLSAIDNNGNETPLSNYHKTIHLSYSTGPQGMNLAWDQYEGFEFGSYYIYKSTTPDNFILIDSISSSFTSYTDIYPPWGNVYYTIEIVNPNGCLPSRDDYSRSRSNVVFNPLVSTLENSADYIHLYPNPTSSKIYIEVGEAWNYSDLLIEVLDLHGKVIQHNKYSNSKPEIELLSIKPGIYLLSVSDGTSKVVRKVIKK